MHKPALHQHIAHGEGHYGSNGKQRQVFAGKEAEDVPYPCPVHLTDGYLLVATSLRRRSQLRVIMEKMPKADTRIQTMETKVSRCSNKLSALR